MVRFLQILLALLLVRVVWHVVRSFMNRSPKQVRGDSPGPELRGEVVRCEQCDLHVPAERALNRGGRKFCSPACASAGTGRG